MQEGSSLLREAYTLQDAMLFDHASQTRRSESSLRDATLSERQRSPRASVSVIIFPRVAAGGAGGAGEVKMPDFPEFT